MFRGRFEHSVDEKGRLAIPSKFREALDSESRIPVFFITNFDKCLVAYPEKEWKELEQKISELPQFDPKVISFQRYYISGAAECQIDKAGRILLPPNLRRFANLEKECMVSGAVSKFEIWSRESWQEEFDTISCNFQDVSQSLSQFNVGI